MNVANSSTIETVTFTTLYPNSQQPNHGIFVENRLRQLVSRQRVSSRVLAPVPWFPSASSLFGRYSKFAKVESAEVRAGLRVYHPKYFLPPKVGMTLVPMTLYASALSGMRRLQRELDFNLIDAHYFYPDGIAAVWLGEQLRKPVVITAR